MLGLSVRTAVFPTRGRTTNETTLFAVYPLVAFSVASTVGDCSHPALFSLTTSEAKLLLGDRRSEGPEDPEQNARLVIKRAPILKHTIKLRNNRI